MHVLVEMLMLHWKLNTQKFDEIYSLNNKRYMNIIKNQQMRNFSPVCRDCDFYRSIYKNYEVYKKYRKKQMTLKNFIILL